jgi:serine/threonine protein kinase
LKHEWEVAKEMHHPNIIRFYEFLTQYHSPFLVLELYSALNLKQVLREGPEPLAYLAEKIISRRPTACTTCTKGAGFTATSSRTTCWSTMTAT